MAVDYTKEGNIAIFTINRPQAMNAVNLEVARELHDAMVAFRDDPDLWVGIVTGAGEKAFCGGADIKETLTFLRDHKDSPWAFPTIPMRGLEIWKPLIAAINGIALGGGLELALACDIRIATENARLGTPEVALGIIPGWGGTQRLPRMVPWCKAAEIVLMGKPVDAQEAFRIGLVNKVVPQAELMATAKEWAKIICQKGPLAVKAAKEAMVRGAGLTLDEGLRLEYSFFTSLLGTQDFIEGTTAFVEKRAAQFKAK
ncbi:MAG: enoyl-CoA hydratase/isomerase family protein [Chloroflexi bacterium]|nr:enoyl-CoA hydratase/isomerase family protein [Chloroflexota bacterium]